MTIAVDFDGTIVEHRYPAIGKEMPYAFETLCKLQRDGHQIILWTAREGRLLEEAVDFCSRHGLSFFAINSDVPNDKWRETSPARKLRADVFIDDRNLGGLPDWSMIYRMIAGNMTFGDIISQSRRDMYEDDEDESRPGILARIAERCRSSREKYNRTSSHRHHGSHHW